jgi:hypothetical protein
MADNKGTKSGGKKGGSSGSGSGSDDRKSGQGSDKK